MTKSAVLCFINLSFFFSLVTISIVHSAVFSGKDITPILFGKNNEEIFPAAFGDFNADKLTDVFTITKNRSSIQIYFAHEEESLLQLGCQMHIKTLDQTGRVDVPVNITGISPGDFNGDGLMDLMVTYQEIGVHDFYEILLCTGNLKDLTCVFPATDEERIQMIQEPLLADINGDMVMDLVGEYWQKQGNKTVPQKAVWIFHQGDSIRYQRFDFKVDSRDLNPPLHYKPNDENLRVITPSSNAIVDTDGDTVAELVMVTMSTKGSNEYFFIEYYRIGEQEGEKKWNFELFKVILIDPNENDNQVNVVGQPLFLDLSQTGELVHLLPICHDKYCHSSAFKLISSSGHVSELEIQANEDNDDLTNWRFIVGLEGTTRDDFYARSISFRVGDYNMDGFPDLIGTLRSAKGDWQHQDYRAVIFENVKCMNKTHRNDPCDIPRTFRLNLQSLSSYKDVAMATFYDIYEDGLLDVILVRRMAGGKSKDLEKYSVFGMQGSPDYDANFLKVVVTTGKPCPKCPFGGPPYGNILTGPIIKYIMSTQDGMEQTSIAAQMYRTSHLPLDLPYLYFGLGHSPNFIETMDVYLSPTLSRKAHQKWTQLIPNSQIIIIPYPGRGNGKEWKAKIFLPSSKAALHTFGVLVSFCAAIFFIVLVFHWKERREDRQERLLESHRFHMM